MSCSWNISSSIKLHFYFSIFWMRDSWRVVAEDAMPELLILLFGSFFSKLLKFSVFLTLAFFFLLFCLLFFFSTVSAHYREIDKFQRLSFGAPFTGTNTIQHFQHRPWSLPSTSQRRFGILRSFLAESLPAQGSAVKLPPLLRWRLFRWRRGRLCTRLVGLREQFDGMWKSCWTSASQSICNVHMSA